MRGKRERRRIHTAVRRITPADAGKTESEIEEEAHEPDHPRGCGENRSAPAYWSTASGITPADAGKTQFLMLAPRRDQDHPRGCGENCQKTVPVESYRGSPPRMRGKHGVYVLAFGGHGITPADAGKTRPKTAQTSSATDHPRGCGENAVASSGDSPVSGSPPRMRGKPAFSAATCFHAGITPADAGKTISS